MYANVQQTITDTAFYCTMSLKCLYKPALLSRNIKLATFIMVCLGNSQRHYGIKKLSKQPSRYSSMGTYHSPDVCCCSVKWLLSDNNCCHRDRFPRCNLSWLYFITAWQHQSLTSCIKLFTSAGTPSMWKHKLWASTGPHVRKCSRMGQPLHILMPPHIPVEGKQIQLPCRGEERKVESEQRSLTQLQQQQIVSVIKISAD